MRVAKSEKKIIKYGTDQNGRITVRVNSSCPWVEVTSGAQLENYIRTPPIRDQQLHQGASFQPSPRHLRPRRNAK